MGVTLWTTHYSHRHTHSTHKPQHTQSNMLIHSYGVSHSHFHACWKPDKHIPTSLWIRPMFNLSLNGRGIHEMHNIGMANSLDFTSCWFCRYKSNIRNFQKYLNVSDKHSQIFSRTLLCFFIQISISKRHTVGLYAIHFAGFLFSRIPRVGCYSQI